MTKKSPHENSWRWHNDIPELIVGRLEAGCNGDVEEGGEEEMLEPSFDHHHPSGVELLVCHHKQLDAPT